MKISGLIVILILLGAVAAFAERRHVDIPERPNQIVAFKNEIVAYLAAEVSKVRDDISRGVFKGAEPGEKNAYYELELTFPKNSEKQKERDDYAISLVRELNIECARLANAIASLAGYTWFSKVTIQDAVAEPYFQITIHLQARKTR